MEVGYDLFALRDETDETIWAIRQLISNDLMHGLVAATRLGLLESYDYDGEYMEVHTVNDPHGDENIRIRELDDLPRNRLILKSMEYRHITRRLTLDYAREGYYYSWVFNGRDYDLVESFSPEFFQGVLTMCNAFNMSVNNVLVACPLYNGQYYQIEGVQLPLLPEEMDGDAIGPLDPNWTVFPKLPDIEPAYIIQHRDMEAYLHDIGYHKKRDANI